MEVVGKTVGGLREASAPEFRFFHKNNPFFRYKEPWALPKPVRFLKKAEPKTFIWKTTFSINGIFYFCSFLF